MIQYCSTERECLEANMNWKLLHVFLKASIDQMTLSQIYKPEKKVNAYNLKVRRIYQNYEIHVK